MRKIEVSYESLVGYLESDHDNSLSRKSLMKMIIALMSCDNRSTYTMSHLTEIQDDDDWDVAMDILRQYRDDCGLADDLIQVADWCEEQGVRLAN